jgi:diguanylate cyclase (GGDEF)-like protein/PAS domain S-box-containing protein
VTEIDLTETARSTTGWAQAAATSFAPVGDLLTDAVVIADAHGGATYVNRRWREVTGQQDSTWWALGWLEPVDPKRRAATTRALLADLGAGRPHHAEWTVRTTRGEHRCLALTATPKVGPDGALLGFVVTASDVTAEREQLRTLAHRATHDPLTGLYNRGQFLDFVGHAVDRLARQTRQLALLFIDVDGLKETNDHLGHGAGDRLLQHVADCIRSSVRPDDVIARYGGDEFTVLCEGLARADDALAIAHRVQDTARSSPLEGAPVGLSIGVAAADRPGTDPHVLIAAADDAMYVAKELKPGTPIVHGRS